MSALKKRRFWAGCNHECGEGGISLPSFPHPEKGLESKGGPLKALIFVGER
jgi:hypothetical protein